MTHTHTYTHASGLKNDFTAVRSSTGPLTRNIEYSIFVIYKTHTESILTKSLRYNIVF